MQTSGEQNLDLGTDSLCTMFENSDFNILEKAVENWLDLVNLTWSRAFVNKSNV